MEKPKYNAIWEKKEDEVKYWRQKNGLNDVNIDTNPEKLPDPSLKWVDKPDYKLKERRKEELLKELMKCEDYFEGFENGQKRIENKENSIVRLTFKGLDTVTFNRKALKERRIKELIDDMTKKFGNQVLGVHGQELPKFEGSKEQMYWTNYKDYKKSPRI